MSEREIDKLRVRYKRLGRTCAHGRALLIQLIKDAEKDMTNRRERDDYQ